MQDVKISPFDNVVYDRVEQVECSCELVERVLMWCIAFILFIIACLLAYESLQALHLNTLIKKHEFQLSILHDKESIFYHREAPIWMP